MSREAPRSAVSQNRFGRAADIRPTRERKRAAAGAWLIVALLFLFMLINFADKAVLGIAAVPLMTELRLSPRQFGLLASSFYLLFALSAVVTGFIVNRVPTRWALLVMGLAWGLTQFPMVGSAGFLMIMGARVALGAAEGPAYPVALHSVYKWFPNELRALPTAVVAQGAGVGIMVALPALNWVIVHYSWHWAFGVLGVCGLLWSAAWLALGREGPLRAAPGAAGAAAPAVGVPYRRLLFSPTMLACWGAGFGAQWGLSLALSWFGAFFIKGLGLSQSAIGLLGALPAGLAVVFVIGAGWGSQQLLVRGVSSRVARGILGGACVALGGAAMSVIPWAPGVVAKIALTTIGVAVPSAIYVIGQTVVAEITPVAQRGALLAIGTAVSTSAGLLAPYVMGSIVQRAATPLAGFETGFMMCGLIMLAGGLIGMALIRPEREARRWPRLIPQEAVRTA